MEKRKLSAIPRAEATSDMLEISGRLGGMKYIATAELIEEGKILLLYFYEIEALRNGKTEVAFRTFLSEDDYITQDLKTQKVRWKTASFCMMDNFSLWDIHWNEGKFGFDYTGIIDRHKPKKERVLFMLIKEKNILIVAVDHGFCSLKLPHMVMENGVTKIPTEPAFKENAIFYMGGYYKVGEGRLAMKDEKTEDDDYFILTLAAIAEELKRNGLHHHNNVVIAAGTPFGRIGKEKDVFAKYLNRGFQEFQYCGEKYSCRIADVKIFPQCYAAVANRLGNMEADQLVVDIGSKTIDVVHVRNHRPVETECFSHPQALIDCTRKIQNVIYNQFNVKLPEDKIHAVMNNGQCRGLSAEIVSAIQEQLALFAEQVEGKLKENGYNPAITPIIYCGGGAVVMRLYGKTAGEHICYMEDVKANAIGYEFIAAAMYRR